MANQTSTDLLRGWQESAPYWRQYSTLVRKLFEPITVELVKAAGIERAQSVLDVAGGAGEPSLTIARSIKDRGSVVFTDAVREMVRTTRVEANSEGLNNLQFIQCVGEALPFQTQSFDAVVSRLGVMLFSDPAASIAEMLRVLKPDGRVALAVWHTQNSNPFFYVVANIVARYVQSPPDEPDAPGAFRFAERGKLDRLLVSAGAIGVTSSLLKFTLEAAITPREFWQLRSELSETLRSKLATLTQAQLVSLASEVEKAGETFYDGGSMRFPAEVLIISGGKGTVDAN
jgi:SAM-dependent methyltransferase